MHNFVFYSSQAGVFPFWTTFTKSWAERNERFSQQSHLLGKKLKVHSPYLIKFITFIILFWKMLALGLAGCILLCSLKEAVRKRIQLISRGQHVFPSYLIFLSFQDCIAFSATCQTERCYYLISLQCTAMQHSTN